MYEFTNEKNTKKKKYEIHKKPIRSIEFDASGKYLFSGATDKAVKMTDVETSQVKWKQLKAHDCALYKVQPINEYLVATGDDEGSVKLWDFRTNKVVMEDRPFDDYVSSFFVDPDERSLVAGSGEGTRKKKTLLFLSLIHI